MTKALGQNIYDFCNYGLPEGYYHADDSGIFNLVSDKEYLLEDFGYLVPIGESCINNRNAVSFKDAYLAWKGIEKPTTFEEWFESFYSYHDEDIKDHLQQAWNAAIASIKESK